MKILKKLVIFVICVEFAFLGLNTNVSANVGCNDCDNSSDDGNDQNIEEIIQSYLNYTNDEYSSVLNAIKDSNYYQDYSNKMVDKNKPLHVYKTAQSSASTYSAVYYLKNEVNDDSDVLVFILSNDFKITKAIKSTYDNDMMVVENMVSNESDTYSFTPASARGVDCKTFVCDEYKTTSASTKPICSFLLGGACAIVAPTGIAGFVLCYAGSVIACNTPANKTCVSGTWHNVCPM